MFAVVAVVFSGGDGAGNDAPTGRIAPGETVGRDVKLTSSIYQLDQFVVAGEREGAGRDAETPTRPE